MERVLVPQLVSLARHTPEIVHQMLTELFRGREIVLFGRRLEVDDLTQKVSSRVGELLAKPEVVIPAAMTGMEALIGVFLTLVVLFYFMLHGARLAEGALWTVPPRHRVRVRAMVEEINPMLGRYVRGIAVVVLYATLVAWLGIGLLFHWPHAVPLSLATGLLELIPVVGPIISGTMLAVVAIQQESLGVAIGFAGFAIALRLSIDQIVGPVVLGRAVTIHPVVVIFAFLAGGTLLGILGVIIAVPIAATVKIVLWHLYREDQEIEPS